MSTSSAAMAHDAYICSTKQRRVWQRLGTNPSARVSVSVRIPNDISLDRLRHAVGEVSCRHEILRTRFSFASGEGAPVQLVTSEPQYVWLEDLGADSVRPSGHSSAAAGRDNELVTLAVSVTGGEAGYRLLTLSLPALCADP